MREKTLDLTGNKYGRLTAIKAVGKTKSKNTLWLCECECGNKTTVNISNLRNGHTKSCGCYSKELKHSAKTRTTHGKSYSRIYSIWQGMKQRGNGQCEKEHYYDRGVRVCEEWMSFEAFYDWAINNGYSDNLTLDRKDVLGNYEPTNCRWITQREQNRNKRNTCYLTLNGETKSMGEWHEILGIPFSTMSNRKAKGLPDELILKKGRIRNGATA